MQSSYDDRKKYERNQQFGRAKTEKLGILCSLTGKFGQKVFRKGWSLYTKEIEEELIYLNKEIETVEYAEGKYKLIKIEKEVFKDYIIPDIVSFITSYSRTYLHELFYDVLDKGYDIYYCDTDSIFTNMPLELYYPEKIGNKLKQLKNELVPKGYNWDDIQKQYYSKEKDEYIDIPFFDKVKFYLPKVYITKRKEEYKIKAKGISLFMILNSLKLPLEKTKVNINKMKSMLNSFEVIEKMLFKSGFEMERYLKYKSSLRRNDTLISKAILKKRLSKIYDKRIVNEDLTTSPMNIQDTNDLNQFRFKNLRVLREHEDLEYINYIINEKIISQIN